MPSGTPRARSRVRLLRGLGGTEHDFAIALHHRPLVVEPQRFQVRPVRTHVQRITPSVSACETRTGGNGFAGECVSLGGPLLEPEENRRLVRLLFETKDLVGHLDLPTPVEELSGLCRPREAVRGP